MLTGSIYFCTFFVCLTEIREHFRFADRDMTMRYHWGLGIGHTYAHGRDNCPISNVSSSTSSTVDNLKDMGDSTMGAEDQHDDTTRDAEAHQHDEVTRDAEDQHDATRGGEDHDDATRGGEDQHDDATRDAEDQHDDATEPPDSEPDLDYDGTEFGSSADEYSDTHHDEDDKEYLELHDTYHPDQ